MRRYLVTGGLGFLGAPLVRALVRDGHRVRVLDNGSRGNATRLGDVQDQVELVTGDIRDAELVGRALQGIEAVCHLAFVNGTRHFYERPGHVLEVGVKGMINVIEGCGRAGVRQLYLASSSEVYQRPSSIPTDETVSLVVPDPHNPRYSYGGAKIISELLALHWGREWLERIVIFRPHNVYGPDMGWEHVIPQLTARILQVQRQAGGEQELAVPIQGSGTQSRAFIYIDDFIDGLLRVIEHGAHLAIYHIGTTEEVQIREVAQRIAQCLGVRIRVVPGPQAVGGTDRRCPDIRKLQALGFSPKVTWPDGLKRTVAWYASHVHPSELEAAATAQEA